MTRWPDAVGGFGYVALAVLISAGAGAHAQTFVRHRGTVATGPKPSAIAIQDINGDGIADIITADTGDLTDPAAEKPANNELSVLLGGADLNFSAQPPLRGGFAPYSLVCRNVDGRPGDDILVANFMASNTNAITVFRNLGEAHFEPIAFDVRKELSPYTKMTDGDGRPIFSTPGITSIVAADLDRDGILDLAATGWSSDVILYWPGSAETLFGEPRTIQTTGGPRDIQAHDLDRDGALDLAVVHYSSSDVSLWKGNGRGGFEPPGRFPTRGRLPTRIRIADMNQDRHDDIVVSHSYSDDSIAIFYGEGDWDFSVSQELPIGKDRSVLEHEIRDLAVASLNGDARPDLVAACFGSGRTTVLLNASADSSIPQRYNEESYRFDVGDIRSKPRGVCVSDINRDGAADIAVALWGTNSIGLLLGKSGKPAAK